MDKPYPFAPRRAYSQTAILEVLKEHPGFVPLSVLVATVFGEDTPVNRSAFRNALQRLRERLPGIEIESVPGYRLRESR